LNIKKNMVLLDYTVSLYDIYKIEVNMIKINEIISEVSSLPVDIKTEIIEKLLNDLMATDKNIDKIWAKESERRLSEIRSGKVKTIPSEEVDKEIQKILKK
jgi:putative addiction module component (TIGR02574 family)